MIPLRMHRLLALLLVVSACLALLDDVLLRMGVPGNVSHLMSGIFAGGVVFFLAYEGGRILCFCGKGLVEDPVRRAKIRTALFEIGVREERRTQGRQGLSSNDVCEEIMYVSVVDSDRFIAITVNEGGTHRAFISTRLVDTLTPNALRGVLSHEYGHVINAHPLKQALILGMLGATKMSIGVPLGAVAVVLMAYLFMLREWEYVADAVAAKRSSYQDVFAAFAEYKEIVGEKDMNLVSEFFCGHPSINRRIDAIRREVAA